MNLSHQEELFLMVLRHSMWEDGLFSYDDSFTRSDFKEVLRIAQEQAVLGLVGDVLVNRTDGESPLPTKIGVEIGFLTLKIQTRHKLVNSIIAKIVSEFKSAGIKSTLLKGQGLASLYPNPLLRQSGDIDLYVDRKEFDKAVKVLYPLSDDHSKDYTTLKHFGCECGGIEIELHRYSDYLSFRRNKNRYFQTISAEGLCNTGRNICIGGEEVQLPTGHYDSIFILQHLWNHLVTGGVGFRQICDWMVVVDRFSSEIDSRRLERDLAGCGLLSAWKYIAYISVNYLGLSKDKCPLYSDDEKTRVISEELVRIVFEDGNFGTKNGEKNNEGRPDNYIGSKIHSLKNNFRRLRKTVRYVDRDDRLSYYLEYLRSTTDRL